MCKYCTDGYTTLIDSTKISNMIWFFSSREAKITNDDIDEVDNSVVFEIRNGSGYIRLGDRGDMGCLDHGGKIKIDYCMFCGRKLSE